MLKLYHCIECGKSFASRQSRWNHKQRCVGKAQNTSSAITPKGDANPVTAKANISVGPYSRRDTEPGILNDADDHYCLYLPPIVSSTYCSFVLLSLSDIFDTRDNGPTGHRTLGDRFEWSIMTTCHLSPVTYHLCHLWPPVTSPLATLTSVTRW